jgi:hypothetical protein
VYQQTLESIRSSGFSTQPQTDTGVDPGSL